MGGLLFVPDILMDGGAALARVRLAFRGHGEHEYSPAGAARESPRR